VASAWKLNVMQCASISIAFRLDCLLNSSKSKAAVATTARSSNAVDLYKKQKATLIIAKLDRLARNVAFISTLMESSISFLAADNPHANKLMLHMPAAFAEHERDQIRARTKAALAAARSRGVVLGRYGRDVLSKQNRSKAVEFARQLAPVLVELHGHLTFERWREP
jgi:hypothetical protein